MHPSRPGTLLIGLTLIGASSFVASPATASRTANAVLTYSSAALLTAPRVTIVTFVDPAKPIRAGAYTKGAFAPSAPNLAGAITASLSGSYATWWQAEYSTSAYALGAGGYAGSVVIDNPELANASVVNDAAVENALVAGGVSGTLVTGANVIDVVVTRKGQRVTDGVNGNSQSQFCAYHGLLANGNTFVVLPNQDANFDCQRGTAFDTMTSLVSHELVETVTDPDGVSGWTDPSRDAGEIADVCEPLTQFVAAPGAPSGYLMSTLWSNLDHACHTSALRATLHATYATGNLTISLTSSGVPVAGAAVVVTLAGTSYPLTTNTAGTAVLANATVNSSPVSIVFAGNGLVAPITLATSASVPGARGATSTPVFPPGFSVQIQPTVNAPGRKIVVVVYTTLLEAGVSVRLSGNGHNSVATSDASGRVVFQITAPMQLRTYVAWAVGSSNRSSDRRVIA